MILSIIILFIGLSDIVLSTSEHVVIEKKYYNVNNAEIIFNKYIAEYDKSYSDETEFKTRFEIFKDTLRKINQWNAMYPLTTFNINQFSDRTLSEVTQKSGGFIMEGSGHSYNVLEYVPTGGAPDEIDYRKDGFVTDVKKQGDCGSCYVFSSIGNIEGQYAKKYGKLVSLSEQQCLDCDYESGGCMGGDMNVTMTSLSKEGGSMREEDYPYNGRDRKTNKCNFDASKVVVKVKDTTVYVDIKEDKLKDALASIGPLSIGMFFSSQMMSYGGGIFDSPCDAKKHDGNHALVLVGYGSEGGVDYWIIKNSWGKEWGEKGYMRLARGKNLCLIGSYICAANIV